MTMANRIGVMDAGRLEQVAAPRDLYEAPATRWVASFVGDINLFEGDVIMQEHRRLMVTTRDSDAIVVAAPRQSVAPPPPGFPGNPGAGRDQRDRST